ncbi:hypothetical protein H2202_003224 [Exophiala xenobiotica]|nr:hypothetical protein H2202_003224 [Exophiala xenobiotica]KAK5224777.1 hypothetical protein LTR72_004558 [Exophiala xenobiotica]KAK5293860.1 hypothetical protein LTR14_004751 [Exophiala xenobiotica]KAK5496912.1 hypothetical protein LTR55_001402 [Exophiala xenobiotica]
MTSSGSPSSGLSPSMGPGARPTQPGQSPGMGLAEIMQIRSKYSVTVEPETLQLGYELNGYPRTYRLPFESMPLGGLSRWWLFGGPRRAQVAGIQIIDFIRGSENLADRPVTQSEAEALAFYATKRTRYSLYGNLGGCFVGGAIAYRTRDKMKFPFRAAQPLEKYQNFPSKHLPMLTGKLAQRMWQITRANVWAALTLLVIAPLFSTAGNTTAIYGMYKDDRTRDLMMNMKGSLDRIGANRHRTPEQRRTGTGSQSQSQSQTQAQAQALGQEGGQYGAEDSQAYYRDSERTDYSSGNDFSGESAFTDGRTDTGVISDSSMQSRESRQPSSVYGGSPSPTSRNQPPYGQSRDDSLYGSSSGSNSNSGSFFDDDDASPTAGNGPDIPPPQSHSRPGSWARIRSENQASPNSSSTIPARGQRPLSERFQTPVQSSWDNASPVTNSSREQSTTNPGDSFSFSNTDADRQLAREQAQKEFDTMLDKERRASGSDEYDRGMRAVERGEESAANSGMGAWEKRRNG